MMLLTLRTDKPEAEIGLYKDTQQIGYTTWLAHRQLAETLHGKIRDLLTNHGHVLHDIDGIACFKGPGSFTGLRIGLSVGNALAYAENVPMVGETGDDWLEKSLARLTRGENDTLVLPEYGAEVHITRPKH